MVVDYENLENQRSSNSNEFNNEFDHCDGDSIRERENDVGKAPWANPKEEGDILADPLYLVCVKNYNEFTIVDCIRKFSRSLLNEAKPTSRLESSNISSTSGWTMFSKNCA